MSAVPALTLRSPRLRLVEIVGDGMEPTLRPRDFALCQPVHGYEGEGLYVLTDAVGGEVVHRIDVVPSGSGPMARLMSDNPQYTGGMIPLEEFNARVLAIVVADVKVRAPNLLRKLIEG